MIRNFFGKIFPFLGAGNESEDIQKSGEWEHLQETGDEISHHEFLDATNRDVSSGDIKSHSFLENSDYIDVTNDSDVSLEIKDHALLTESGEHVLISPAYSPRSGSSVDPADKYPVNLNGSKNRTTPVKHDGSGDKLVAKVRDTGGENKTGKERTPQKAKQGKEGKDAACTVGSAVVDMKGVTEEARKAEVPPVGVEIAEEMEGGLDKAKEGPTEGAGTYIGYVHHMTANKKLINAKDLFYQLGFQKGVSGAEIENAAIEQYKVAADKQAKLWIKDARYYAEILFSEPWIDENLPPLDGSAGRRNRGNKKKKEKSYNINEQFEVPGGTCRDFRLKDNPDLETLREDAASSYDHHRSAKDEKSEESLDRFVSDYTNSVIDHAIKMAIGEGLSESTIMEVIEDVTTCNIADTPRKGKLTPLDPSRVPRPKPDQLAMGFNFHSDVVVKESPKTLHGEIIPIDLSKQPRERPEQIAVGFNYHSDVIVKESPRAPNGEILIEPNPTTPRRRARDQLAVGFSYHSKLLAKEVVADHNENIAEAENKNDVKDETVDNLTPEKDNEVEPSVPNSCKKSFSDTFAVGFSYNSDLMMKEGIDLVNDDDAKTQETEVEGEMIVENGEATEDGVAVISEMIGEMRVAGSVW